MRKFKLPFVWRKDYDLVNGALIASAKGHLGTAAELINTRKELDRQVSRTASAVAKTVFLERSITQHKEKLEEEISRADHFQKRCEAYEDAAKRYALRFVRFEETEIFYLEKDLPSSVTAAP